MTDQYLSGGFPTLRWLQKWAKRNEDGSDWEQGGASYEKRRGLLNAVEEVGSGLGLAVYQLPFWHYTTPLVVREGARSARRWVFLASYIVERDKRSSAGRRQICP